MTLLCTLISRGGYRIRYRESYGLSCCLGAVSLVIKGHKIDAKTSPLARLAASFKNATPALAFAA